MLRRAVKRQLDVPNSVEKRKLTKRNTSKNVEKPLGSIQAEDDVEKALETLVVGGESDILETLQSTTKHKDVVEKKEQPAPVWHDEDEDKNIVTIKRKSKLNPRLKHGQKKEVVGEAYKASLNSQFEKVTGSTPDWAKLQWEKPDKSDNEEDDELLRSTQTYLTDSAALPKGVLQMKKCTNANIETPSQCKLRCLEFHPTAQVMLTAGANQTLNLFQIDGKNNPKIQSVFLEKFPILCAHFTSNGDQVIMSSKHKSFYHYDMIAGKVVNVPKIKGIEETALKDFSMTPDGKYIIFLGRDGHMHMVSAQSKEWISTLKMNGRVSSVSFTHDGQTMYSIGNEGEVYVWDLSTRDCVHRFVDEGCFDGTAIDVSRNGQYLATGSYSGVVNVYERSALLSGRQPKPLKAVMNMTSPCTHLKFNSSSEILALASNYAERALKMVHLPSLTTFSNFPTKQDALRIPQSVDFSLNSGYFALGNHRGQALLYRVQHYDNY